MLLNFFQTAENSRSIREKGLPFNFGRHNSSMIHNLYRIVLHRHTCVFRKRIFIPIDPIQGEINVKNLTDSKKLGIICDS